jgi:hypothetical protein
MSFASNVKCEITTVFSSGVGSAKSNIRNISSVVDVHTRKHLFKVMRSCVAVVLCTVCNSFFYEKINKISNVKCDVFFQNFDLFVVKICILN